MPVYIIEFEYTKEMVCKIFSRLCFWEICKRLSFLPEAQDFQQSGYIKCIQDIFGESNEDSVIKACEQNKSWIDVVSRILSQKEINNLISNSPDMYKNEQYEQVKQACDEASTLYINSCFDDALYSLKSL